MNIKNNKRRKNSQDSIENAFVNLIQTKSINEITVSEIIEKTNLNRSTFYANYADIYDLADKIRDKLDGEVQKLYVSQYDIMYSGDSWLKLFHHIKDNQIFYNTYFKLGYDQNQIIDSSQLSEHYKIFPDDYMEYHVEFFKSGFNAIIKLWLKEGCKESPEQMSEILKSEYNGRKM